MPTTEQTTSVSVGNLQTQHLSSFNLTLSSILSTDLAGRTFAQIIDGIPVRDDVGYFPIYSDKIANNHAPSPEAIEAVKGLPGFYNTSASQIDSKLAQRYQGAAPGSTGFYLQLLEMLAVACHNITAFVFDSTKPGLRREGQDPNTILAALEGRPTDFMHEDYTAWQQYPKGISDMVGYWAEYHLFGGVVLFDRGESGIECKSAFLHPVGSFMVFQLSDSQILQFSEYVKGLVESTGSIPSPFPFRAEKYVYRVDPFDAMALNIFRDKYERIILPNRPAQCVQRLADFPELKDAVAQINNQMFSQ